MKSQRVLLIASVVLLTLVLAPNGAGAQGPTGTQPRAPRTALGTAFTYQGQLKRSGSPYTGTCDFQFGLWDALGSGTPPTGGTQIGGASPATGVSVTNGLFTAQLNGGNEFGTGAFTGEARWLQIAVKCGSETAYTTLSPRQPLTAAPYAFGLRFSAEMDGATSGGGSGLVVNNTSTTGGDGVYGHTSSALNGSAGYSGMHGESDAPTDGFGVGGASSSSSLGAGVGGFIGPAGSNGTAVLGYTSQSGFNTAAVRAQYAGGSPGTGTALEVKDGAIRVTGAGIGTNTAVFVHRVTSGNTTDNFTCIDNPLTNGDPNAIVIATHVLSYQGVPGVFANHAWGVWYYYGPNKWCIYNEDSRIPMAVDTLFNVLVVKP